MPTELITSFNAGELSPYLAKRTDVEKYRSGCETLENFILTPYGGVYRCGGTEYIGKSKYGDKRHRMIGFNFSTETNFQLEMGEGYFRFWTGGDAAAVIEDPNNDGVPLEVASPYTEDELREVQYIQINDIMYFVHASHPVYKMSRLADNQWTFSEMAPDWPALLDENIEDTTITASATTGTITLTASADLFQPEHVGSYWQIAHRRDVSNVSVTMVLADDTSDSILTLGAWSLVTSGSWKGTLHVERSANNADPWEKIRSYTNAVAGQRNVSASGSEDEMVYLRLFWDGEAAGSSTPNGILSIDDNRAYGFVKITAVATATSATATVMKTLNSTAATKLWSEGAWSVVRGFPRTVAVHEGRIIYGGTSSRPLSLWGTVIDDFENFRVGSNDDAGLFFTLSSNESNPIQWMISQGELLIGTAGDEWSLASSDTDTTLTPTNVQAKRQSCYGSKYLRALIINDVILFVQRQGRKTRELAFSFERDGWVAPNLTALAEHITHGEILEVAFQQQPDAIYWTVTGDGVLAGMTYDREQNVVGWYRRTTQGEFESVSTIYGQSGPDEVWVSVKRTLNGETVRCIERFHRSFQQAFEDEEKENWWYLDCARRFDLSPAGTVISGPEDDPETPPLLEYLEGSTVDVLMDGATTASLVVTNATLTLPEPASRVLVGLPYTSTLQPMPIETELQDGSTSGRTKRIAQASISYLKSLGGEFSTDGAEYHILASRDANDPMDDSPPAFTGDREAVIAGSNSRKVTLYIRQTQPLPLTLLALTLRYEIDGR